jgi:hypothetical protein
MYSINRVDDITYIKINLLNPSTTYTLFKKLSEASELDLDMGEPYRDLTLKSRVTLFSDSLKKSYEEKRSFWNSILDFFKKLVCITTEYDEVLSLYDKIKRTDYQPPFDPVAVTEQLLSSKTILEDFEKVSNNRKGLIASNLIKALIKQDRHETAELFLKNFPDSVLSSEVDRLKAEENDIVAEYIKNPKRITLSSIQRKDRIGLALVKHYLNQNNYSAASQVLGNIGHTNNAINKLFEEFIDAYSKLINSLQLSDIAKAVKNLSLEAKRYAVSCAMNLVKKKEDLYYARKVIDTIVEADIKKTLLESFLLKCEEVNGFETALSILQEIDKVNSETILKLITKALSTKADDTDRHINIAEQFLIFSSDGEHKNKAKLDIVNARIDFFLNYLKKYESVATQQHSPSEKPHKFMPNRNDSAGELMAQAAIDYAAQIKNEYPRLAQSLDSQSRNYFNRFRHGSNSY